MAGHAGRPRSELPGAQVSEAKPVIRAELLEAGDAIAYSEPERAVTSRSGDDCVVALTDQWYIIYGELEWEAATQCARPPRKACALLGVPEERRAPPLATLILP